LLLAVVFGVVAQNRQVENSENDLVALLLGVVAIWLFFTSLTIVPMFQFNGLIDMGWSVLLGLQAGVIAFVLSVSLSYN